MKPTPVATISVTMPVVHVQAALRVLNEDGGLRGLLADRLQQQKRAQAIEEHTNAVAAFGTLSGALTRALEA